MSYATKETSVADGSPFFLYEFNTGSDVYYITGHSEVINWDGKLWYPLAISHGEIKQSSEMSKNATSITLPLDGEFSQLFKGWSPDKVVTVNIRRGHFGELDTLIYWKGRISTHKVKDRILELQAESIFTSLRNSGVRARFQRNCRHSLYGNGCRLNKEDFAVSGKLTNASDLELTVPEAAAHPDGWFNSGIVRFSDGSTRMVLSHIGSIIRIGRASRYVVENLSSAGYGLSYGMYYGGMSVILYPGCDKTVTTCLNKFNNLDNQGGFRWIPTKNPMGGSSII